MQYYNSQGKIEEFDTTHRIARGCCANIHRFHNTVFKEYYTLCITLHISCDLFLYLKQIKNSHFINLMDYYYKFIPEKTYEQTKKNVFVDAYTYQYVKEDKSISLLHNKDYFLENLYEIEKLIHTFTEYGLFIDDFKRENAILTTEGLVIIDPDLFYINETNSLFPDSQKNKAKLIEKNNYQLINLFSSILSYELESVNIFEKREIEIFPSNYGECQNITDAVVKKLKPYKQLIDFY